MYLLDEPSAYLDSEQRMIASRVIKRFIMHTKKTAFVVEHDFIMATYLADRVVVFDGQPGIDARANKPESLLTGCNKFLKNLDVTFRRDPTNFRPRINKLDSQLDQEQKMTGNYVSEHRHAPCPTIELTWCSSSWRIPPAPKHLEKGNHKNNGHGRGDDHGDSSSGVLGVQKKTSLKKRKAGQRRDLELEEGGAGEDDDPDE